MAGIKVLPGLFIGTLKDAQDKAQLKSYRITHIVSVYEEAKENPHLKVNRWIDAEEFDWRTLSISLKDIKYLCIRAADSPQEDLQKYFPEAIEFIHRARIMENGNVLIHW